MLPASVRLKQFLNRGKWLDHIHKHVSCLNAEKPLKCPHPQPYCATLFDSVKQLQFHLQDAHGIPFIRETVRSKRKRDESEDGLPVRRKRRLPGLKKEADTDENMAKWEYAFINSTIEKVGNHGSSSIKSSSGSSTPLYSSDSTLVDDDISHVYETPLSSVYSEDLIDPAILSTTTQPDLGTVEVVDLTSVDDVPSAKFSTARTTTSMY